MGYIQLINILKRYDIISGAIGYSIKVGSSAKDIVHCFIYLYSGRR